VDARDKRGHDGWKRWSDHIGMPLVSWTTPGDLRDQVLRLWKRGNILSASVTGETLFPLKLLMRRPEATAMGQSFEAVRGWIRELEENSRSCKGFGYEIEWADINHRQLGRNRMPNRISIPTESDALRLIGKEREGRRFRELANITTERFPALAQWVSRRPLVLLDHVQDWPRILDVLAWFRAHPRSNLYLRQVDIAGVDTKFVEARLRLFSELLDIVLERHDDPPTGTAAQTFEQRYGLRSKPPVIRFRVLDRQIAIAGLSDIAIPADDFASLNIDARYIFITENDVNGLAFPDFPEAIVVFGLGAGVGLLHPASWMSGQHIYYWGDIDTHGFAILDRLRARFPNVRSFLMNRETLLAHRSLWVCEHAPYRGALSRLDEDEQALFDDLLHDRLGERVRLEQERISYALLGKALQAIGASLASGVEP
jgi:hypothetical protein